MSQFLKEIGNSKEDTPAAIFYEQKIRSFVFFSDHLPVKGNSAILSTHNGYKISACDIWDSYLNHFGKYVIDGAQIFLGFAPSDQTYDHFYCQRFMTKEPPDVEACKTNLKFIKDVVSTHYQYVKELRVLLKQE